MPERYQRHTESNETKDSVELQLTEIFTKRINTLRAILFKYSPIFYSSCEAFSLSMLRVNRSCTLTDA